MLESIRPQKRRLIMADLAFKLVATMTLLPFVSVVFRTGLSIYGENYLADADIALFALHPLGIATVIVVVASLIGVFALELVTLQVMFTCRTSRLGDALAFTLRQLPRVLALTSRITVWILLVWLPFVAVCGVWYLMLLTEHDINYYLDLRPPAFWFAVALAGLTLMVPTYLTLRKLAGWALAIPCLMLEDLRASEAFARSVGLTKGHGTRILLLIASWLLAQLLTSVCFTTLVALTTGWLLNLTGASLAFALIIMVVSVVVSTVGQVLIGALAMVFLAAMIDGLYQKLAVDENAASEGFEVPPLSPRLVLLSRLGLASLIIVGVGTTWVSLDAISLEDKADVIAHRGFSAVAPENSLAAIAAAIEAGADYAEIDVQESADGKILVIHDQDLMKIADVPLRVDATSADELRQQDIGSAFGPEFSDERIPTLREVLELCRGRIKVNIELKTYGKDSVLVDEVARLVEEEQMVDEIVVMSLKAKLVQRMKKSRPDWQVGQLVAVAAGDVTRIDADFLALNASMVDRSLVSEIHRQDRKVLVWTVNEPLEMSRLLSLGVDGLITDHPDVARQVIESRKDLNFIERWLLSFGDRLEGFLADGA